MNAVDRGVRAALAAVRRGRELQGEAACYDEMAGVVAFYHPHLQPALALRGTAAPAVAAALARRSIPAEVDARAWPPSARGEP